MRILQIKTSFLICSTALICSTTFAALNQKSSVLDTSGRKSSGGPLINVSTIAEPCIPFSSEGTIVQYGGFLQTFSIHPNLDTDNDGLADELDTDNENDSMPDQWEIMYNLNSSSNDASGDADSDRLSNIVEYQNGTSPIDEDTDNDNQTDQDELIAGTSPTDDTKFFKIDETLTATNNSMIISWHSLTGRLYSVFNSTNLPDWSGIPGKTNLPGSGNTMSYTNNHPKDIPEFYRIKVKMEP